MNAGLMLKVEMWIWLLWIVSSSVKAVYIRQLFQINKSRASLHLWLNGNLNSHNSPQRNWSLLWENDVGITVGCDSAAEGKHGNVIALHTYNI